MVRGVSKLWRTLQLQGTYLLQLRWPERVTLACVHSEVEPAIPETHSTTQHRTCHRLALMAGFLKWQHAQ
jgi:DNA integrity scanning protein DisA with diadenylate cyclase activity